LHLEKIVEFFFLIIKYFVDVDDPFLCFQNGGNSPHKNHLVISLIFILKFLKNLDKSYNNLKDCLIFIK